MAEAEAEDPLMLYMENACGEDVALRVEPEDDFQTFLLKAKSLLGFEVDINSITQNQPVSLNDNIYQFLLNSEANLTDVTTQSFDQILAPNPDDDTTYILDDGTQIRASQIHFDNEDPQVDLTTETIPFVRYTDDVTEEIEDVVVENTIVYNIVGSPIPKHSPASPKCSFINSLPFRLVSKNSSGVEAQFTKVLESYTAKTYATLNPVETRNKSPKSLIRDKYKEYDDSVKRSKDNFSYTREEILNMCKNSAVTHLPYESPSFPEKRRHVRKTDPSRMVFKNWNKPISYVDVNGMLIAESESQNCFICDKYVDSNMEKLYLFDNEDQKLHRSSPQKKMSTQLKIICEQCLDDNFKPCRMKISNQSLNADEYLVIRNNQQYIFQKTKEFTFKNNRNQQINDSNLKKETYGFVKVEIGSDGEIVTNPIDEDITSCFDDAIIVKDEGRDSSSDVEIVENGLVIDDNVIDNLEEADEEVKEFLGKYQCDGNEVKELKCRFCERIFSNVPEVIEHGQEHRHDLEEGEVYPCPLCDYGYANFKWLKGHLIAAHEKNIPVKDETKSDDDTICETNIKEDTDAMSPEAISPIATRTRSAAKKNTSENEKEVSEKPNEDTKVTVNKVTRMEVTTEFEHKVASSDDDEIWIVQTADDEADRQMKNLLLAAKNEKDQGAFKKNRCHNCGLLLLTENLTHHKCRRRGKNQTALNNEPVICVPSHEDFIKRAHGRPRQLAETTNNELLTLNNRKKKDKEPTSDPQIVTCNDCNESFTSKVRLKFHMQFHDKSNMLSEDGSYLCIECDGTTFETETALFDHVHFQHHKQKRWQCPVYGCGKTFYLRATLTKHSRVHTDTRRYICGTCGKRFLDKQTLDEHGVTHLRIKPFQCHICLKQLTRRSRLRMHLRAHDEAPRARAVRVCAACGRAFRHPRDAQEHITKFPECIEKFANELKEEESVTVHLSPTSGLVQTIQVVEPPKWSKPIKMQVDGPVADELLAQVPEEARAIVRVVEIEKAFRCEYCEDVFYSEEGLNNHRVIHKNVKNPFTCHICKVSFATYSRCTTHKTTHGFYKRPLAEAKRHAELSPGSRAAGPSTAGILGYGDFPVVKHFLCEDCGRSYLHWTYLQVHRRMKHANDNFTYKCNMCDQTFPNSWSVTYHRKKAHGKAEPDETTGVDKPAKPVKERENYKIPCRDCDEVLPNKSALYKHRKKEHTGVSLCDNNNSESFRCPTCGQHFLSAVGLRTHGRTHAARPACAKCGHSFTNQAQLHQHLKDVHGQEPEHTCGACKKSFASHAAVSAHACSPRHACAACGRVFRTASMLQEHVRVHTGERPFPCDVCGVAFRRSTAMRNHRLIHTGVRAWACADCPKRFRVRSHLATHRRLKHPLRLAVIEVAGLTVSPEQVMESLARHNIPHDKVVEISKISFPKGARGVVPAGARALARLGAAPRTQLARLRPRPPCSVAVNEFEPSRRGRGIAKNPRRPKILQRERGGGDPSPRPPAAYPMAINVSSEELSEMNVQLVLHDGATVNGNQMLQMQMNNGMLAE